MVHTYSLINENSDMYAHWSKGLMSQTHVSGWALSGSKIENE